MKDALQVDGIKLYILKSEIQSMVLDLGFQGDNIEEIVDTCFSEVTPGDRYNNFEGLFYNEYLQAIQWLALVFIQKKDDQQPDEEDDEEVSEETLVEKTGFLLETIEGLVTEDEDDQKSQN